MIRILCTGDSHTWGQGVSGIMEEYDPPVVAGDLRLASFRSNGYVNVLRRTLEKHTGSYSQEWYAKDIADQYGIEFVKPCAIIEYEGIEIAFTGSMLRIELQLGDSVTKPEVIIDHVLKEIPNLCPAQSLNNYRLYTFLLEEGEHTVSIRAIEGQVLLYKVESYGGSCAVINSGVGSCSARRYYEEFWDDHVMQVQPDIIIAEAHTINDWLLNKTAAIYKEDLKFLIKMFQSISAKVVLLTVSPIRGNQFLTGNKDQYSDYVEVSRMVAAETGVEVCDANAIMSRRMSEENIFDDDWHPNEHGHAIYTELLKNIILNNAKN